MLWDVVLQLRCCLVCRFASLMSWRNRIELWTKKSGNCHPWNFVIGTSIIYYQRTVLKYLSWNPSMLCITTLYNDFSARSKCWWSLDKQSKEGDSRFLISSTSGYTQLTNSATHIIGNSSSFIDLIFTQPPNRVTSSVVHST